MQPYGQHMPGRPVRRLRKMSSTYDWPLVENFARAGVTPFCLASRIQCYSSWFLTLADTVASVMIAWDATVPPRDLPTSGSAIGKRCLAPVHTIGTSESTGRLVYGRVGKNDKTHPSIGSCRQQISHSLETQLQHWKFQGLNEGG